MPKHNNKAQQIDPLFLARERAALKHCHRKTINFNRRELAVIDEYCSSRGISAKGPMMRRIIMEKILEDMGKNPPTLF